MSNKLKVGVIIVDDKENILLIKEKVKKNSVALWNIIKGTYGDNGPETIFEAAIREAREEAGVKIELINLLGVYISELEEGAWTQFTFLAKIVGGTPLLADVSEQQSRDETIEQFKWFSRENIINMKSSDFISERTYAIINDWLKKEKYLISVIKQI